LTKLKKLLKIDGITSILTSGGKLTAQEGKTALKNMVSIAKDRLEIVTAGSITNENIENLHQVIKAKAYHGRRIVGNLII